MTLSRVLFLVDCETSAPEKKFTEKPFGTIVNYFASRPLTPLGTPRATCASTEGDSRTPRHVRVPL